MVTIGARRIRLAILAGGSIRRTICEIRYSFPIIRRFRRRRLRTSRSEECSGKLSVVVRVHVVVQVEIKPQQTFRRGRHIGGAFRQPAVTILESVRIPEVQISVAVAVANQAPVPALFHGAFQHTPERDTLIGS